MKMLPGVDVTLEFSNSRVFAPLRMELIMVSLLYVLRSSDSFCPFIVTKSLQYRPCF